MNQQHIFQSFFDPQTAQIGQLTPEYIIHNEAVLEIINNWTHVNDLMNRHKTGKLQKADKLEEAWFTFLVTKNIDITLYKNEEEFKKVYWKIPDN
jgi:hypothetical protein